MRKALGFLLFFSFQIAFAQKVSISGNASFFKNEPIQVFKILNALTSQKTLISETNILEDGSYHLDFNLSVPSEIIVKIEMRELRLNLHPKTALQIDFFPIKHSSNQRNPLKYIVSYNTIPLHTAPDSVYKKIEIDFANYQLQVAGKGKLKSHYDQYFITLDSIYAPFVKNDTLFNIYYTYLKADAYLQTDIPKSVWIQKYILNKPINYSHSSYLKFFKTVMNTRINSLISKNPEKFQQVKKEYKIYESLLSFTKEDTLMGSDELRSLSILLYTNSNSSTHNFSFELKTAIINQISNFSIFPQQKEAALFFQSRNKHLKENSEAPNFELLNSKGENVSLTSFRGNPLYMGFIYSESGTCQRELKVIETLRKKYRKINFLIILTDRDSIDFSVLPKESSNFTYLFLNNNYGILEKYEIWNYPIYYLIDAHGYFIQSPGKHPIDMFETFAELFAKKTKKKSYEIIKE